MEDARFKMQDSRCRIQDATESKNKAETGMSKLVYREAYTPYAADGVIDYLKGLGLRLDPTPPAAASFSSTGTPKPSGWNSRRRTASRFDRTTSRRTRGLVPTSIPFSQVLLVKSVPPQDGIGAHEDLPRLSEILLE